jgi:hypothetical protein
MKCFSLVNRSSWLDSSVKLVGKGSLNGQKPNTGRQLLPQLKQKL